MLRSRRRSIGGPPDTPATDGTPRLTRPSHGGKVANTRPEDRTLPSPLRLCLTPALAALLGCGAAGRQPPSDAVEESIGPAAAISPIELTWREVPDAPGEPIAILSGDPTRAGEYTLRRRFPPGHATLPHWHPHTEYGTVISGTFLIGFGDVADRDGATPVGPGGFIRVPAFTPHFSYADEEVVLQMHGNGPRRTYFVHETPVPRR